MACFAASTYRACPLNCSAWWSKKFKGWSANHQCQHQFGARAGIGRPRLPCIWSNIAGVQNCFNVTIQCWNLFLVIVNVTSQSWSWSWLKVSRRVQIRCLSSNSKVTVSHSPRAGMEVQGQMKRWHYNFWPCGRFNSVESTPFDIYGACQDVVRFPNSQETTYGTTTIIAVTDHHHHHGDETTRCNWRKTRTTMQRPPTSTHLLISLLSGFLKSTRGWLCWWYWCRLSFMMIIFWWR